MLKFHLVNWAKQNVSLETFLQFFAADVAPFRGDVLGGEAKVDEDNLELAFLVLLNHNVLRLKVIVGSSSGMYDLKRVN